MNAKAYLRQIRKLDILIENKLSERERWRAVALNTTARYDGERVQTSGSKQTMADAMNRYVDLEREIDADVDKLINARRDILSVIEQLNATEYDLLHKHYVQFLDLYVIAQRMDRSYSWVTTVHGRALKNVQKILDEREAKNECL